MKPRHLPVLREYRTIKEIQQWKFEQIWLNCSRVMNVQSLFNRCYGGFLNWQLYHFLRWKCGELPIGFVHKFSLILIFYEISDCLLLVVQVCPSKNDLYMFSGRIWLPSQLTFQKNINLWKFVYKTNGEFSTLSSQKVVVLPI